MNPGEPEVNNPQILEQERRPESQSGNLSLGCGSGGVSSGCTKIRISKRMKQEDSFKRFENTLKTLRSLIN